MKQLIVFTGGHHNSTEIAKLAQNRALMFWLGHKFNSGDNKSLSGEYLEVTESKFNFRTKNWQVLQK
jgi:hypothetical protein